jgi:hypothetical protein
MAVTVVAGTTTQARAPTAATAATDTGGAVLRMLNRR